MIKLFKTAYEALSGEDEWIHLGPFGSQLNKLSPAFDPRNYGYKKLSSLITASHIFLVQKKQSSMLIKLKDD